ncbi:uncharacterized protein BDR25DRAFT_335393 [Lindgomyces ingoldianus]|uniref:Uncharacterized protein n=1 Tax=Lindgomyces ingoldianus TaxID=673940 RepID=A0ACB6QNF9_9PLEO|nr:uncharacterized protein BDR25DRAFT_335393 [Lindgomyces ingoldianus]KAF2468559.1 hypothetical protein BDR25DRAFT_335393 [Lindgomyces ingoldianus]
MSPTGHRGKEAIEVSGVFTALAFTIVGLRLYTRFFIVRCAGIEDYFITLAMFCSTGLTICIGIQVEYGMGQHIWELLANDMRSSLKAFWASLIVYYLSLGLTKTSILLQYRRVFPTRSFQIACWSIMTVVIAYTVWAVFGSIFACVPVRAFWTKEPSKCINQFVMWFTNAGINILTDFAIIILPMPVIRNLNLARRQKQALVAVFALGGFVCVVSILRLQSLVAISNSSDPTFDNPPAASWSSVETNVGIICSCLPCLRPLMARYFPGIFSSKFKSGPNSSRMFGRSLYGRQSAGPSTVLGGIELKGSKDSRPSSDVGNHDNRDDRIQVVTEFHVRVEDKNDRYSNSGEKGIRTDRGSSTEISNVSRSNHRLRVIPS